MKRLTLTPVAVRILQILTTEGRGDTADMKHVVRVAPKWRRALEPHLPQLRAMAEIPAAAAQVREQLADETCSIVLEDADFDFVKARFDAPQIQFPDGWAESIVQIDGVLDEPEEYDPDAPIAAEDPEAAAKILAGPGSSGGAS